MTYRDLKIVLSVVCLLFSFFFRISVSAEITVNVGNYTTLTFEVNSDDTSTVRLTKCVNGGTYGHSYQYGDGVVNIPSIVKANGVNKIVTQIGDDTNTNNSYLFAHTREFRVVFPSTVIRIAKFGLTFLNYFSGGIIFDFSNTTALDALDGLPKNPDSRPFTIENLTIRNGVKLSSDFPYSSTRNLQYDPSSKYYDLCGGGCLMEKGVNDRVLTILRNDSVCIPNTVKKIVHGMIYGEKCSFICFEEGSQIESIAGQISNCVIEEFPMTIKELTNTFRHCTFLKFTLPSDISKFKEPFSYDTFNEFNWGNDPTLTEDLFIGCTFDQPLQIPEGFTTTNNAFRFATFNKSLTFPVTFTKLSNQEFYGCTFNEGIILPNEITIIPDSCFAKTTFKKRLLLPESLKNINFRSFAYAKLDSGLIMNNNLKTIGSESFSHMICKGKFITAPKATIDPTAFGYSEIDSMQFTGSYFNGLGTMSELDYDYENPKYKFSIKIKVLDLGLSTPSNESFNYIGLSEVYTHRTTPPTVERLFTPILLLFDNRYDATLWVPYGSKLLYENTEPWSFFSRIKVFGDIKPGDVNGDYSVNIKDLTFLINSVLDGGSDDMLDVNEDGTVDVKDVTALINLILE